MYQRPVEDQSAFAAMNDPEKNSWPPGKPRVLRELPPAESITEISIAGFSGDDVMDDETFRALYAQAVLLEPDVPDGWHYAPRCSGSFRCNMDTYHFTLFLGGRGMLTAPDRKRGLFSCKA